MISLFFLSTCQCFEFEMSFLQIAESYFFNLLCQSLPLIVVFGPFVFRVIIDMVGLKSAICFLFLCLSWFLVFLCFVGYLSYLNIFKGFLILVFCFCVCCLVWCSSWLLLVFVSTFLPVRYGNLVSI